MQVLLVGEKDMAKDPKFYNLEEVDALALKVLPKAVSTVCHAELLLCSASTDD